MYGGGGSGVPAIFEPVHGTRRTGPAAPASTTPGSPLTTGSSASADPANPLALAERTRPPTRRSARTKSSVGTKSQRDQTLGSGQPEVLIRPSS